MLILTIKTDNPLAEVGLYTNDQQIDYMVWEAHRQLSSTLHVKIQDLLVAADKNWTDIQGIVFYKGPGSFTGLRIGASVANALASDPGVSIISANGDNWVREGILRLLSDETEQIVVPEYGSEPRTTNPKK